MSGQDSEAKDRKEGKRAPPKPDFLVEKVGGIEWLADKRRTDTGGWRSGFAQQFVWGKMCVFLNREKQTDFDMFSFSSLLNFTQPLRHSLFSVSTPRKKPNS